MCTSVFKAVYGHEVAKMLVHMDFEKLPWSL